MQNSMIVLTMSFVVAISVSQELRAVKDCCCAPHATGPLAYIKIDLETNQNDSLDLLTVYEEVLGREESMWPQLELEKPVDKSLIREKWRNELMVAVGVYEYVTPISLVKVR